MKKLCLIALVIVLTFCLAACGRRDDAGTSTPSTDMTILPNIEPTLDTNIPDPSVDTQMPVYTDGTDAADEFGASGSTGNAGTSGGQNGSGF